MNQPNHTYAQLVMMFLKNTSIFEIVYTTKQCTNTSTQETCQTHAQKNFHYLIYLVFLFLTSFCLICRVTAFFFRGQILFKTFFRFAPETILLKKSIKSSSSIQLYGTGN